LELFTKMETTRFVMSTTSHVVIVGLSSAPMSPALNVEEAKQRCNLLSQAHPLGDIPRQDRDEDDPSWRDDPPYTAWDLGIKVKS
jgi:hypothetical protein